MRTPGGGRIERVHTSERGYGNALFFAADDGLRFTFAHLHDFRCEEASDLEYFRQALELLGYQRFYNAAISVPAPPYFRFAAGDCIARTGESGSGPPHLHFEVWKDGRYLDPLALPGVEIADRQAPTLVAMHIQRASGETLRIPLEPMDPGTPVRQRYRPAAELPALPAGEELRIFIGGYDLMASRNRNGVYSIRLLIDGKESYARLLSSLSIGDLARAGEIYDVARTNVGKEYVYNLSAPGAPGLRLPPAPAALRLQIELRDEAGNVGELTIPLQANDSATAGAAPTSPNEGWIRLPAGRAAALQLNREGARVRIDFPAGALFLPGEAQLLPAGKLPAEAQAILNEGKLRVAGPIFELRGRDLYLRSPMQGSAQFAAPASGRGAVYIFTETIGRWAPLAALARCSSVCAYRFDLQRLGFIAQLEDRSPAELLPAWLWQAPGSTDEPGVRVREYIPVETGAGFDPRASRALLDGRELAFEWIPDRGAAVLRIPEAMIPARGAVLALQAIDLAGNLGQWRFEFLERSENN